MARIAFVSFGTVIAAAGALLVGTPAHADVTMHMKLTEDVGSASPEITKGVTFIATDRMAQRSDTGDEQADHDGIFRADRDVMWFVDHENKTYREIDRAAIDAFAAKMSQAMAKMKEQLASLPPEQRAMMEKNLGAMMPGAAPKPAPKVEYRKTSETKSISGFDCTKYEREENGKVAAWMWVAPNSAIGLSSEDQAVFAKMGEFMQRMLSAMGPAVSEGVGDEFAAVSKLGGWPILTQSLGEDGKVEEETLVESIAHDTISGSVFELPEGYKPVAGSIGDD
jgi:hypothetical protein